ncbi:MAG: MFS transporter [Candidatus Krumholzibacteriota bacterium]|nr:MFS transporter [Candidatus Krumholzibacteriota bacterium]
MELVQKRLNDSKALRWMVLILISTLLFSTYWFQDCMGPLKGLMESQLGFDSSQFGTIVASTTWANLALMIILGGMALDKWGIRKTGTFFAILAGIGAFIVALASAGKFGTNEKTMMIWMMIGRILFGTGLETVCVMVSRTIVKWFKGYELALAMAINVGFGRLGSAGANFFGVDIAGGNVSTGLLFAASLVGISVIAFLAYLMFDVKFDKRELEITGKVESSGDSQFKFSDLGKLLTDNSFMFIALLCVAFYAAVFPFVMYAPDLLINKFGFTSTLPDMAGMGFWMKVKEFFHNGPKVTSLIPLGTILFTPVFGSVVDKKGKAATLMILGSFLLIFAHLSLSVFNSVTLGYFGLLALGIAFSLVPAAMWPSVAKIVAENRLGTAYATMFTIQNYGLAAFFWGIGKVLDLVNPKIVAQIQSTRDNLLEQGVSMQEIPARIDALKLSGEIPPYNYTYPILMLVGLGIISIFLAYQLKRADKRQGYGLEMPTGHQM